MWVVLSNFRTIPSEYMSSQIERRPQQEKLDIDYFILLLLKYTFLGLK